MKTYLLILLVMVFGVGIFTDFADAGGRGGGSFSSSSSSRSSFSSRPATSSSSNSFKSAPINKAPSVTKGLSTPSVAPIIPATVNNHYYGGSSSSGMGSSPWFWLWLLDRPHGPQVITVNGQPQPVVQSEGPQSVHEHSGMTAFLRILLLTMLVGTLVALIILLVRWRNQRVLAT